MSSGRQNVPDIVARTNVALKDNELYSVQRDLAICLIDELREQIMKKIIPDSCVANENIVKRYNFRQSRVAKEKFLEKRLPNKWNRGHP